MQAPKSGNPYPPGIALPPVDGHVATISGGPLIIGSTRNAHKRSAGTVRGDQKSTFKWYSVSAKNVFMMREETGEKNLEIHVHLILGVVWEKDELDLSVGVERMIEPLEDVEEFSSARRIPPKSSISNPIEAEIVRSGMFKSREGGGREVDIHRVPQ
uniref:Uncharacterized protein n=1 Tax=Cannabis sativa TaxID=3483 RepID=A0A803PYW9_CANSA